MELSSSAKENLYADYGTIVDSNVAIVSLGIESKILGGNNYQSDTQDRWKSLKITF